MGRVGLAKDGIGSISFSIKSCLRGGSWEEMSESYLAMTQSSNNCEALSL